MANYLQRITDVPVNVGAYVWMSNPRYGCPEGVMRLWHCDGSLHSDGYYNFETVCRIKPAPAWINDVTKTLRSNYPEGVSIYWREPLAARDFNTPLTEFPDVEITYYVSGNRRTGGQW